jgi:MarR family 2-MHQ and catechol resistance regulon transcriptional repressor
MDSSGVHLWVVLWKAYDALREHAHRDIAAAGLGLSEFAILEVLLHKGALPVNTIGAKVRLTSGSITTAVDRLERKGLVERRAAEEDRRARIVHLTAQGRALITRVFRRHAAAMERATSGLNASERERATALLRKLGKAAEAMLRDDVPG